MANVLFTAVVDWAAKTVTFTDNGTNWTGLVGDPASLTIYMKGEIKTSYVVKKVITDSVMIDLFSNGGIVLTFEQLFDTTNPADNFYLTEIVVNEGLNSQMLSNKVAIAFTYEIAALVHRSTIGVLVPINDLSTSLTLGSMPQILEYLQTLGTDAAYDTDRENKWRKSYNYLNTIVNDLNY